MRKATFPLITILCALLVIVNPGARGGGPLPGHIEPLSSTRRTNCNVPGGQPLKGIAHLPYAAAPAPKTLTAAPAFRSNSSFEKFNRCPPGELLNPLCNDISLWKPADDRTSYYRDVIFAATTIITNATDGETWSAEFTQPDGTSVPYGTVVYVEGENCFYFPGQPPVCGSSSIRISWYFDSQCSPTGKGRFKATNNGNVFADEEYVVKPQIAPVEELAQRIEPWAQHDFPDVGYGGTCHRPNKKDFFPCSQNVPGQIPWTIAEQGCGLVSVTAILDYHGVYTDPVKLNQWLMENEFYDAKGDFDFAGPAKYARQQGVDISFLGLGYNFTHKGVSDYVCKYGPMFLRVANNKHAVTALGMDDDLSTLTFLESADGDFKELSTSYNNKFDFFGIYARPQQTHTDDQSGMSFKFHSPVEAFVVDPLGRRKGLDPRTGVRYDEIPDASYGEFSTIGPVIPDGYEPPKLLDLRHPAEGAYTLTVVGTGEGTYDADFTSYDRDLGRSRRRYEDVATAPGAVHTYLVEFSKEPGSQLLVAGGFDGGGQRPRDVNKFLSYAQPLSASTALPAGTTSYPLLVFFGQTVIPSTFRAQLNGVDITSLFAPSPGGSQAVTLTLQSGRNVLQLSTEGNLPNRIATDSDRLILDVP